ncbi:MAG: putative Co/Zn/Cd efflux system membrane fusion protein [Cytophagales bacterium]|jgi:multidrug efflux pump subunit AcrA (membrane-fusion protein)|nr:efflux RND transporter periplasmic adaptor subunit [Bacteroidota bacterium]WHZ07933.1 MAG: putative Co/Zn/Cd efflux system membrane fusion protein [Cytophagales bacterium]
MKNNLKNNWPIVNGQRSIVNSQQQKNYRLWTIALLLITMLVLSCKQKEQANADTYTCPMHPSVSSNKPGQCPVCGMTLILKTHTNNEAAALSLGMRLIPTNEAVISSAQTTKGERKIIPIVVKAQGWVTYDTRNIYTLAARVAGRLDKVYIKYAFQPVQKGQKIADLYSPELLTAQRELLFLIENDPTNSGLIETTKNKLYLLGATQQQVETVIKNKTAQYLFSVYSPYDGYLVKNDQPTSATSDVKSTASANDMNGGLSAASAKVQRMPSSSVSNSLIREGNYVRAGETLFNLVNTASLRFEFNLPLSKSGEIKAGDQLTIDLGHGLSEKSTVDFVQPFFSEGEEFVKIRVYQRNNGLQIGQLISAAIEIKAVESFWIPQESALDLGMSKIVFVKENNTYKPKKIMTGMRTNGFIEVKDGLTSSDEIALNAQYLVDSESFIKVK